MKQILFSHDTREFLEVSKKLGIKKNQILTITFFSFGIALTESIGLATLIPIFEKISLNSLNSLTEEEIVFEKINFSIGLIDFFLVTLFLIFSRQILNYLQDIKIVHIRENIDRNLRKKMLDSSLKTNLSVFVTKSNGDFVNFILNEPHNVSELCSNIFKMIFCVVMSTIYLLFMFYISLSLSLIFIILISVIWFLINKFTFLSYSAGNIVKRKNNELYKRIGEIFRGIKFIKIHSSEKKVFNLTNRDIDGLYQGNIKYGQVKSLVNAVNPLLFLIALLVIIISNFLLVIEITLLGVFLGVIYRMYSMFSNFNSERIAFSRRLANYENFLNFFNFVYSSKEVNNGLKKFKFSKKIIFEDVYFKYPNSKNFVLRKLNFVIRKNKTTAIVGNSGSGKSTIIDMLSGFYPPTKGKIFLDHENYKNIDLSDLRNNFGIVSQNTFLFRNTLKYNLLYQTKGVGDSKIWKVLEESGLKEFVNGLDKKLLTIVGEDGARLSGGQRQRVSFARCILQNKKFIILDEPTSSVDTENARIMMDTINNLKGSHTIIIISHNYDAIKNVDYIFNLQEGKFINNTPKRKIQ
tara:strand:- start:23670 stop:25403 length:1734 start_codon:yes stop_codon:yes gene_type:complete